MIGPIRIKTTHDPNEPQLCVGGNVKITLPDGTELPYVRSVHLRMVAGEHVTADIEAYLGDVDVVAEGEITFIDKGKRYRLVEIEDEDDAPTDSPQG